MPATEPQKHPNNLRRLREARGLSQAKLGEKAGTSAQQIDRLEKGERKLQVDQLNRLAPALEVQPHEIFMDVVAPPIGGASRLKLLRTQRGLTVAQLAELTKDAKGDRIDEVAIDEAERGVRRLTPEWMHRLAEALGVSPDVLHESGVDFTPARRVPVVGKIAAGNWREAIQDPTHWEIYEKGGPNVFGLKPDGDSMNLAVPDPNAIVYVDPDDIALYDGRVYAFMNPGGETTFKRYRANPAQLEPVSSNPKHKPIPLGGDQPYKVIGRVIGYSADL